MPTRICRVMAKCLLRNPKQCQKARGGKPLCQLKSRVLIPSRKCRSILRLNWNKS